MQVDLDDWFRLLICLLLAFLEDFGSSWGLKADLHDSYTLSSRFIGGLDPCYDGILEACGCCYMLQGHLEDSFRF